MLALPVLSRDIRVNALIGTGHFLSHFYVLCLPPMFLAWQHSFAVPFWELGLSVALMSGTTALLQTPVGFMVDRWGARCFLIGGTLLMTLSICGMGLATAYWQILVLAALSGVGNSVIHPADYAILTGSVNRARMGSAFALHTFNGNLGTAASPLVTAALMLAVGWRSTLLIVGLFGVPLVATIVLQSAILQDQHRQPMARRPFAGARLLLTRSMLLFFFFFLLSAMAGGGITSWLITVLHQVHGLELGAASSALMAYVSGATGGILIGGWVVDRTARHLSFALTLTVLASGLILLVALEPLPPFPTVVALFLAGVMSGASRTPRDVMVRDAAPPGQIGKVFGFVSAGLPLGQALVPVPFGFLIDSGRPELVLVLVAFLFLASMAFAGSARVSAAQEPVAAAAD